ncbi:MAG: hypothetical protein RMJ98_07595 [Myxococcales bacterium]|nr:hypothetical protein [Polyangiaceae bacterium]MDW8249149.1 hypothetical protein [Myxococcales bacterium]
MKNLHKLLVERGVASMRQVEEAMARQVLYGGDLATYVLEQIGQDHEGALNLALADYFHLTPADAGPLPLATEQVMQVVPRELALRHGFYPLKLEDQTLVVAVSSQLPESVEGDLFFHFHLPTKQLATSQIRIKQALARDGIVPLDPRERRILARIEGRPLSTTSSVPPPAPTVGGPPSVRAMTLRLPAVRPPREPSTSPAVASVAAPDLPQENRNLAWPQATRGLLRWMQQASKAEAPSKYRRRRGPMPLGECEENLLRARTGEEVLHIFFDFAQQYFIYSALFVVQGDLAEGRDAFGAGADPEKVAGIGIPLDLPSCLAQARNLGAPVSVPLRLDGIDASLAADLKRSPRKAVFVLPIMVRQRCIALLYGDNGEDAAELADAAEVIAAGSLAGNALERLAMERKRRRSTETGTSSPSLPRKTTLAGMPAIPTFTETTSTTTRNRYQKASALARALGLPSDLPRAAVPPPTVVSPQLASLEDSNPFRKLTASFDAASSEAPPRSQESPPATVAVVPQAQPTPIAPVVPPAPEAPEVHIGEADMDDELVQSALREVLGNTPTLPRSERASYHPPTPPPSEHKLTALPSIIVDLDDDQIRLLDRLTATPDGDDEALSEILKEGVRMVPALLSRQPGPLRVPREHLLAGEVRPSQAGPLLRALVALRRTALPFVVVQSGSSGAEPRLLATLMLGEFPYTEAVHGLIPRFFDTDPAVARAALTSARWLRTSPEVIAQISAALQRIQEDPEQSEECRAKARDAMEEIWK